VCQQAVKKVTTLPRPGDSKFGHVSFTNTFTKVLKELTVHI
jgi:hypothetical protein